MKKLIIGLTVLSALIAAPSHAQDFSPLKQAEYETMMKCIGNFEGGIKIVEHLTNLSADKSWSVVTLANSKKVRASMDMKRNLVATAPVGLDTNKGEAIRAKNRKPFEEIISSTTPREQWAYFQKHGSISEPCMTILSRAGYALYR